MLWDEFFQIKYFVEIIPANTVLGTVTQVFIVHLIGFCEALLILHSIQNHELGHSWCLGSSKGSLVEWGLLIPVASTELGSPLARWSKYRP